MCDPGTMVGTSTHDVSSDGDWGWLRDSLFALGWVYGPPRAGKCFFQGTRPGPDWYGHGYFPRWLTMLVSGKPLTVCVFKHRWIHKVTGKTCHSRPPDDPVLVRFCTLIVVLRIYAAVSSKSGFCNRPEAFEGLETGCGSDRTVQRWTSRAVENGMEILQAIRLSIIEESEPRPMERLFDGGLSPPDAVMRRRWKSPLLLRQMYLGYEMLLVTARTFLRHASILLAGARWRWPKKEKTFGI
jgi:hypothetical protein